VLRGIRRGEVRNVDMTPNAPVDPNQLANNVGARMDASCPIALCLSCDV
jgi:hypothetical protein